MRRFGRITLASMLLDETMSQADFDELEEFLYSDTLPKDCMDLAALDGFLTALAIGPAPVRASEWFPKIWGTRSEQPIFQSRDEADRIRRLVMRFYNDIVRTFSIEQPEFEPLFNHHLREEAKPFVSGEEWCIGFYIGFFLRREDWEPLCEDKEHEKLLDPIFWFADEEARQEISAGKDPEATREKMLGLIGPSVLAISNYWKPRRKTRRPEPRTGLFWVGGKLRIGPNAPCPCGSGKKLKECCRFVN